MSSTRKTPEHILPGYSSPPKGVVATAVAGTVAAAADTVALEGAAAADAAAEAVEGALEDVAAAEVAATAAAEAAVSGLDLSRSASEPLICKPGRKNLVNCPPSTLVGQIRQIEEGSVSGSS